MFWNSLIVAVSGSHKQDITFTGVDISVFTLQLVVTWFHILPEMPFSVLLHWKLPEAPTAHPESAGLYCALFEQIKSSVTVSPQLLQRFNVISSSSTNITCIALQPEMRLSLCSATCRRWFFSEIYNQMISRVHRGLLLVTDMLLDYIYCTVTHFGSTAVMVWVKFSPLKWWAHWRSSNQISWCYYGHFSLWQKSCDLKWLQTVEDHLNQSGPFWLWECLFI